MNNSTQVQSIRIEFYGIPRERAGVEAIDVAATCLADVIRELSIQLPEFAKACISDGKLTAGYLANVNGKAFTTDPATLLTSNDTVLILSADAGG